MKKTVQAAGVLLCAALFLLACASCAAGDAKKLLAGIIEGNPARLHEPTTLSPAAVPNSGARYGIGAPVLFQAMPDAEVLEYTAQAWQVGSALSDFGLQRQDLLETWAEQYTQPDGSLKEGFALLQLTIAVKNIQAAKVRNPALPPDDIQNIGHLRVYTADHSAVSSELAFFDFPETEGVTRSAVPREYYHYSLAQGQRVVCRLVWFMEKEAAQTRDLFLFLGVEQALAQDGTVTQAIKQICVQTKGTEAAGDAGNAAD